MRRDDDLMRRTGPQGTRSTTDAAKLGRLRLYTESDGASRVPHDFDSERRVVADLCDPSVGLESDAWLSAFDATDFHLPRHARLFLAIRDHHTATGRRPGTDTDVLGLKERDAAYLAHTVRHAWPCTRVTFDQVLALGRARRELAELEARRDALLAGVAA